MKQCPTCHREFKDGLRYCPFDRTPLAQSQPESLVGTVIDDKYRIEAQVGTGGMGTVYRATNIHIGSAVAIKVLHPHLSSDATALRRFRREAQAAAQINHPNAVLVMDFGVTSDATRAYLVMEFLDGQELRQKIKAGPISCEQTVNIIRQACRAVHAANAKGIIHRDLKPENICLLQADEEPDRVKVLDFGIAKLKPLIEEGTLTQFGTIIGTPYYMSPEQCEGAELDARSDVYSLGVVTYEMLTGSLPFTAATPLEVIAKQQSEAPRPLRELRPGIPAEVENVVMRSLAKRREDRPASAAAFALELESAITAAGLDVSGARPAASGSSPSWGDAARASSEHAGTASQATNWRDTGKPTVVDGTPASGRSAATPSRQATGGDNIKPTRVAAGWRPARLGEAPRPAAPRQPIPGPIAPEAPAAGLPTSGRPRRGLIVAIVVIVSAVILLSAALAIAFFGSDSDSGAPNSQPSAASSSTAATKTLSIDVMEGRADVYINGKSVGLTPLAYPATVGERLQIVLKQPGYKDKVVPPITVDDTADSKPYTFIMEKAQ